MFVCSEKWRFVASLTALNVWLDLTYCKWHFLSLRSANLFFERPIQNPHEPRVTETLFVPFSHFPLFWALECCGTLLLWKLFLSFIHADAVRLIWPQAFYPECPSPQPTFFFFWHRKSGNLLPRAMGKNRDNLLVNKHKSVKDKGCKFFSKA